jgi:hypothetical protein
LFDKGIGLEHPRDQRQLAVMLRELQTELSQPRPRKPYSAKRTKGTAALKTLAQSLQTEFRKCSPAIIEHVSNMIGTPRDTRACARYCKAAQDQKLEPVTFYRSPPDRGRN